MALKFLLISSRSYPGLLFIDIIKKLSRSSFKSDRSGRVGSGRVGSGRVIKRLTGSISALFVGNLFQLHRPHQDLSATLFVIIVIILSFSIIF